MRWLPDRTGVFPKRLYFESLSEIDEECERLIEFTHHKCFSKKPELPLADDVLTVLVEQHADLDLYAGLPVPVHGVTEFRQGKRPLIEINNDLSSIPARRNRMRTTLAHEWFHAVHHRRVWELRWTRDRVRGKERAQRAECHDDTIVGAQDRNWMEFQAGYASCAILMPRSPLMQLHRELGVRADRSREGELVARTASVFDVSEDAARWRLRLLHLLPHQQVDQGRWA